MKKFLFKIKAFYVRDFLFIRDSKRITFKMAIAMIFIENLQMLSVYTNSFNTIQYDEFLNQVQSLINYFRSTRYHIYQDLHFIRIACVMVGFLIKTIFLVRLVFLVLSQYLFIKEKLTLHDLPLDQNKQNYHFEKSWQSTLIFWYMKINLEVMQVPVLFCAISVITDLIGLKSLNEFEQIGLLLSFLLIIQQILVGVFLHFHQTDYRIKDYDLLGKLNGLENQTLYGLKILIIFLSGSQQHIVVIQTLGLLINSIQAIHNYRQLTYIDHRITNFANQINFLMLLYQVVLILCEFGETQIRISSSLLILFFSPLIIILFHQLHMRSEYNNKHIDNHRYLKKLYWNAKKLIYSKKMSQHQDQQILFEIYTVVRSHLQECKQIRIRKMLKMASFKQTCFCSIFQNQRDSFQNLEQCKEFLKLLLGQVLEDQLKENGCIQNSITYICYLTEIKKAPISAIYEIIRTSTIEKLQLRQKQIIHQLQQSSQIKFNQLIKKQNLVNQMFDFKRAYQFEESLKVLKLNLYVIVKQEIEFYETLFAPIIDASILQDKGLQLVNNITFLEKQIQLVFRTNPQNGECDTIYKLFQKYINFNKVRPKLFKREGQLTAEFIQSIDKIIYNQNSCVVQITLLQPRGNVIRYTRSFQQVLQYKDDEIMNQNIKKFIPSIIASDHDQYLNNFVETGRINVLKRELRIILVKLKSGFVIPINTRLRIEVNSIEFGAQALMTPVNYSYGYLMLNEQGQIEELTKNIFEDIFKQYLGLDFDFVRGLDFLLMIPDLSKIWESIFDENFEKLDLYLEAQLLIPVIEKQAVSPICPFNYGNKLSLNKRLADYIKNNSQNIIKYQINLHLTSLTTINLRVVIVEIPEYKQTINKQYASQLELYNQQVQPHKTSVNFTHQSDLPTHKSCGINSPMNTPPPTKTLINECDLDYENLIEEKKMIQEFRNQLASITMNNTLQNNSKEPLIQQQQQAENIYEAKIVMMPQRILSYKSEEFEQKQYQQEQFQQQQQYNGSVGSRSSQNNSNTFKMQIKDCLQNKKELNLRIKIFLLIFYFLLLVGYILNFCILYFNFQKIDVNLNFESLPYQFNYYYHEFIIAQVYVSEQEFKFNQLLKTSLYYYQNQLKNVDQIISLMPQINVINNQTLQRRTVNVISQMSEVYDSNKSTSLQEYLNNSDAFHVLLDKFSEANSPSSISSLLSYFILEEILLFILLSSYAYFYVSILKMKIKFFKLFCTFSKDFVKEQFIQYHSFYNQINHAKFKTNETNEESFEASMITYYQKNSTQSNLESQVRVGRQIQTPQINMNLIFFFFVMLLISVFSSSYYFGTYLLQKQVLITIEANYFERLYYENVANHLLFAYSHSAFFYNKTITEEMLQYQTSALTELQEYITQITIQQENSNNLIIQNILVDQICSVFQEGISIEDTGYQNLFSFEQCSSIPSLSKGLIFVAQELFSIYNDIVQNLQSIQYNETSKFPLLLEADIQIERLYSQFSFQIITELLRQEIKDLISQTFYLNTVMFVLAIILASLTLLIAKVSIEKIQSQHSENKRILTLFPYDRLMENAYVHSFISQDLHFLV
ncbi:unnamed protein product (macronuclear) [Paramecium tetraurelia]|uniref:Transmembrane protein n=1 Tax=Paramecium tetraurelia TaxID=5888 RepID=A0DD16_PARTE|nr:uncharacterized protein GSPATT00015792001 [Paramecium tetraurelia]CAK80933.1 unnamed protein product [Paramecium tetraurelia]|eukprot:XP_001448330.1 hypothetical protein (macronuclear) [Paramecium tetraurelia strain d4-2]